MVQGAQIEQEGLQRINGAHYIVAPFSLANFYDCVWLILFCLLPPILDSVSLNLTRNYEKPLMVFVVVFFIRIILYIL